MKKWLVYILGILTGFVLAIAFVYIMSFKSDSESDNGITMFEKPGDVVKDKSFKVMQVIADDAALVSAESDAELEMYMGTVYLITNEEGKYYYDEEIIKAPEGKVIRQIGIYRYPTKSEMIKTVPIIMIMEK